MCVTSIKLKYRSCAFVDTSFFCTFGVKLVKLGHYEIWTVALQQTKTTTNHPDFIQEQMMRTMNQQEGYEE